MVTPGPVRKWGGKDVGRKAQGETERLKDIKREREREKEGERERGTEGERKGGIGSEIERDNCYVDR